MTTARYYFTRTGNPVDKEELIDICHQIFDIAKTGDKIKYTALTQDILDKPIKINFGIAWEQLPLRFFLCVTDENGMTPFDVLRSNDSNYKKERQELDAEIKYNTWDAKSNIFKLILQRNNKLAKAWLLYGQENIDLKNMSLQNWEYFKEDFITLSIQTYNLEMLKYLLKAGAQVNNPNIKTPSIKLKEALRTKQDEAIILLLNYGIHVPFDMKMQIEKRAKETNNAELLAIIVKLKPTNIYRLPKKMCEHGETPIVDLKELLAQQKYTEMLSFFLTGGLIDENMKVFLEENAVGIKEILGTLTYLTKVEQYQLPECERQKISDDFDIVLEHSPLEEIKLSRDDGEVQPRQFSYFSFSFFSKTIQKAYTIFQENAEEYFRYTNG